MKLILFRGRPGVGKTTLSSAFAQQFSFPVLAKDYFYDIAAEYIQEHEIRNKISFGVLYKILEANAKSNLTFVLDYPFQYPGDLGIVKKWCTQHGATLQSILITCSDEELWAKRLSKRRENPLPNQAITDFQQFKERYGTMQLSPEAGELLIDTVHPIEITMPEIIKFVSK